MKTWHKIVAIIGGIIAIYPFLLFVVRPLHDTYYLPYIKEQTKGGMGGNITSYYKIFSGKEATKDDVAQGIAIMMIWNDSLKAFQKTYVPMLLEEKETISIGPKYYRGEMYYLDTLGKRRAVTTMTDSAGRLWHKWRDDHDDVHYFLY